MNTPKAITIVGATFLFWIAARGRFPQYMALVNGASDAAASPAGGAAGSGSSGLATRAAATVQDVTSKVWQQFKAQ